MKNIMRNTLCLVVVTLFAAVGCDKHEKLNENELYFYAKVESASQYSNVVEVKLMVYDRSIYDDSNFYEYVELASGDWKKDGFTIVLPKTLAPNYLRAFTHVGWMPQTIIDTSSTITNSNRNLKVGDIEFWGVDKDGHKICHFFPAKTNEDGNDRETFFIYVDSDVVISGCSEGEIRITPQHDEDRIMKITTIYSIEWKKGWNALVRSGFVSTLEGTMKEKLSSTPIDSLKWYGRMVDVIPAD